MKHFKAFNQHTDYESFTQTDEFIKPNLSYCIKENEWHFNYYTDPRLIAKFYVEDDSEQTMKIGRAHV